MATKSSVAQDHHNDHEQRSSRRAIITLAGIFSFSILCLGLVYYNFPNLDP